jgi:hypothetical protein
MKASMLPFAAAVLLSCSAAAHADAKSYCEAYARDAATARLSGSAIITGVRGPISPEQWAAARDQIQASCLDSYAPQSAAPPVRKSPAPPKPHIATISVSPSQAGPDLKPGSAAWKDYCAKKYVSFDPATGTYQSLSGKTRPCVVGKN